MKMKTFNNTLVIVLSLTLLVTACKKNDENTPQNPPGTGITADFYFQATINGEVITFQDGINGYGNGAGSSGGTVPSGYQEIQSSSLLIPLQINNQAGIAIMKTFPASPPGSEIENMFSVKSYTYGKMSLSTAEDGIDGAQVFYVDSSGVYWSTDQGIADQSGSSFNIIEHIVNNDGWSHKISKAAFSCTLYDDNGNSLSLTNGVHRGRTVQY